MTDSETTSDHQNDKGPPLEDNGSSQIRTNPPVPDPAPGGPPRDDKGKTKHPHRHGT